MTSQASHYRPDIDAVRGLAVIAVLLFHFFPEYVSGGYVGVDVFFVISGYIISQNILRGVKEGKFTFSGFYFRRARRLLPALFTTLGATFIVGYLLFTPEHLEKLGQTIVLSIFSMSNFLFWKEAGYFDTLGDYNPLLHTWSLAIEEQFYLIWPLTFVALLKIGNRKVQVAILAALCFLSVYSAEKVMATDPSAAYLLAPFRVSELCMGVLLLYFDSKNLSAIVADILYVLGLVLVLVPAVLYNHYTPFPGVNSLAPCFGTLLLLYAGPFSRLTRLPFMKFMVFTGLISYSLYLVHWPLLIFYKYWRNTSTTFGEGVGLFALSFVVAYAIYRWIEKPCRVLTWPTVKSWSIPRKVWLLAIPSVLIAVASYAWKYDGLPDRVDPQFRALSQIKEFHKSNYGGNGFRRHGYIHNANGPVDFVVIGDSHAWQYATGLKNLARTKKLSIYLSSAGCFVLPGISKPQRDVDYDSRCVAALKNAMKVLKQNPKATLVIANSWAKELSVVGDRELKTFSSERQHYEFLVRHLGQLKDMIPNHKMVLIGAVPGSGSVNGVINCFLRPRWLASRCQKLTSFSAEKGYAYLGNQLFEEFAAQRDGVTFLNPYDVFCHKGTCSAVTKDGVIYYSDGYHLSREGSDHFIKTVAKQLLHAHSSARL